MWRKAQGINEYFKVIDDKRIEQVAVFMGRSHLFLDLTSVFTTPTISALYFFFFFNLKKAKA